MCRLVPMVGMTIRHVKGRAPPDRSSLSNEGVCRGQLVTLPYREEPLHNGADDLVVAGPLPECRADLL